MDEPSTTTTPASLSIPLTDPDREFVEQVVAAGTYPDAAAYVQDLIRADRHRKAGVEPEELEAEILKGLDSGDAVEMTPQDWAEVRRKVAERPARQVRT